MAADKYRKRRRGKSRSQVLEMNHTSVNMQESNTTEDALLFHNPYHFVPACLSDDSKNREHWLELPEATPANRIEPFRRKVIKEDTLARRLGRDSYRPEAAGQALYSGCLICCLKNITPMFIGATRTEGDDLHPAKAKPFELKPGEPALPASSLRGLIASIAEAASGSSLRVLHDRVLSYRKEARAAFEQLGMVVLHQGGPCLLRLDAPIKIEKSLVQDKESFRWDKKEFYYVCKDSQAYKERKISTSKDLITEAQYQSRIKDNPGKKDNYERGILRILGSAERKDLPENRRYELLIPFKEEDLATLEESYAIPPEVIARFEQLANQRTEATEKNEALKIHPYEPKGTLRNEEKDLANKNLRLKKGDLVYFKLNDKEEVDEIAFSSIWRGRVEDEEKKAATVWRFFEAIDEDLVPFHAGRTRLSPAELLFGFVQEDKKPEKKERDKDKDQESLAYAGRVCFSFGRLAPGQSGQFYLPEVTLKILASPKPPSPALYFKHKTIKNKTVKNQSIAKKELNLSDHIPQGRKFYLHHPYPGSGEKLPWETWKDKEPEKAKKTQEYTANLKQKVCITPIAPGKVFYFHVDFTNLTAWELGLLCYALRPREEFRHKLGMGKPIGLGTVEIEPEGLFLIDRKRRYGEQDLFDRQRYYAAWFQDKESIKKWPSCYQHECKAVEQELPPVCAPETETPGWEEFRALFTKTLDPHVGMPLRFLGDPHKPQHPIHTPQVRVVPDNALEEKTYRWFVANDVGTGNRKKGNWKEPQRKPLVPLDQDSTEIPPLPRHEWRDDYVFFLGGQDLEMVTIRNLLRQVVAASRRVFDKGLSWGARASAYREEIEQALAQGQTPVLVELEDDLGLGPARIALVDHHGPRAGAEAPTSLHQVFELLGLPKARWSRWFELVAANDRGYIPALIQAGATREEIIEVRAADRRAQGITEEQEAAAAEALLHLERHATGLLTVARLPHNRTAALSDRLQPELGGPGVDNLLVISPGEYNFFGAGNVVQTLNHTFPDGWMGGALPARGFWGHGVPLPEEAEVLACLAEVLQMR